MSRTKAGTAPAGFELCSVGPEIKSPKGGEYDAEKPRMDASTSVGKMILSRTSPLPSFPGPSHGTCSNKEARRWTTNLCDEPSNILCALQWSRILYLTS